MSLHTVEMLLKMSKKFEPNWRWLSQSSLACTRSYQSRHSKGPTFGYMFFSLKNAESRFPSLQQPYELCQRWPTRLKRSHIWALGTRLCCHCSLLESGWRLERNWRRQLRLLLNRFGGSRIHTRFQHHKSGFGFQAEAHQFFEVRWLKN